MKKLKAIGFTAILLLGLSGSFFSFHFIKEGHVEVVQDAEIETLEGEKVASSSITNEGKPMILVFWATWNKPAILELSTIHASYTDWQAETGVKLVAISIDDIRNAQKVKPFVVGKDWEYEVYLDKSMAFKNAMNVDNVPETFIVDGSGKITAHFAGFAPGDEDLIHKAVIDAVEK